MTAGPGPAPNAAIAQWISTVSYPACPPAAAPAAAPAPNPASLAVSFWQTIPLPVPAPRIPPGWAITGKAAYLVTNGTTTPAPYTQNTPLGALQITARGAYTIDWGDGSPIAGPFPFQGQPWPDGRIYHGYQNAGSYTVTVYEHWTATWSLGSASGTLAGLVTRAVVPGLEVRQYQAEINSGQ